MNPALVAFIARSVFRLIQEVPSAQADVEKAPDNFSKGLAALTHLEGLFADLYGDFDAHAAAVNVPVPAAPAVK